MNGRSLTRFAWLSMAAALVTIGLKAGAYLLTDSVGLLSDALESVVNLVAAIGALVALSVAHRAPDEEYAYGHAKAEYFSGGLEGGLILLAAASIAYAAIDRLLHPTRSRPSAPASSSRRWPRSSTWGWPGGCGARGTDTAPSRWRPTPGTC
jgi:cation diffusion facilitator family transporter